MAELDPLLQVFFEEAAELLADCEAALLQLEKTPDDRGLLNRIFRCAHTVKGNSGMLGFQEVMQYTHALEDLLELLRSGHRQVTPAVIDVLLTSQDVVRSLLDRARIGSAASANESAIIFRSLAAIRTLVREEPAAEEAPAAPDTGTGEQAGTKVEAEAPAPGSGEGEIPAALSAELPTSVPDSAVVAAPARQPFRRRASDRDEATTIRVPVDRVDQLINLVGELVIAQSIVSQTVRTFTPDRLAELQEAVAQMDRHARELHERLMNIRMVPLKHLFGQMTRLVRDLTATVGKQAALQVVGEDTELDKIVIEKISAPLTHLVRNAINHGLEPAEQRRDAGKPGSGTVRLEAYQQGASVYIEVSDDGQGLDTERILAKARQRGLVGPETVLSEEETIALIFRPGFSTAEQVTAISGRGVGMDVVKRNLESLGGSIGIRSERGVGTCFRVKLPLTVAVLEGQVVEVSGQHYLLPILAIVESVRPAPGSVHNVAGGAELVVVRDRSVPLLRLHRLFRLPGGVTDPAQGLVILVEHEGHETAVLVDDVLAQQQVVIKSLEANFVKVPGIAGATILGNGQVALILDVPELMSLARGEVKFSLLGANGSAAAVLA